MDTLIDRIDLKIVYPFVQACIDTFRLQAEVHAKPQKPLLKSHGHKLSKDIASIVGITGPSLSATVSVCFPESTFISLMSKMLGEKYEAISDDFLDAANEMMNVIFSQAKKLLAEKGLEIARTVPAIVYGKALQLSYLTMGDTILFPLETDLGGIHIEVSSDKV